MSRLQTGLGAITLSMLFAIGPGIAHAQEGENADEHGYFTIMFGRSAWQVARKQGQACQGLGWGTPTLEDAARELETFRDSQGNRLRAVGGIVVNRTHGDRRCFNNYMLTTSWNDLARLRDNYGWKFVSQGMNYEDMSKDRSDAWLIHESQATLPILKSRGHTRAWGAFNYPNNKSSAKSDRIVTQKFAFTRKYANTFSTRSQASNYPYVMRTKSVMGGRCHNRNLPCATMDVKYWKDDPDLRSTTVTQIADLLSPGNNQWGVVQFYRFVQGQYGRMGENFAWDCSQPRWQDRWTSQPEVFCFESFKEALSLRGGTGENADPATVAERWGVNPGTH